MKLKMSMTVSVSSVDLPDDCLWLPDFDIDFWLETEYDDDDFTDKTNLIACCVQFSLKGLWCSLKDTKHNGNKLAPE